MKKILTKSLSLLLVLGLFLTGFPKLAIAAATTEPQSAAEVVYVTSGKYVYNWGKRGTVATFLTSYAESYYTGSYAYENFAELSGSNVPGTAFYNSELGSAIHAMLSTKQTSTTSYDAVRTLLKYTESQQSNTAKLTTFYTEKEVNNAWDGGATWNREHTWPNSKGLNGADENDVLMLKPEDPHDNSGRGNTAYGEGSGYFNPNVDNTNHNLHGDVARLMLQHLMRWGNTGKFYGSDGVIESREVLLKWMAEDPVDTWEMGRNDAVQQITGIRNVFVDYPELGFKLLGESVPDGYVTPSGSENTNYTIIVTVNQNAFGTATVNGRTITAEPAEGYYVKDCTVTSGTATYVVDGNKVRVSPTSDCAITVNFAPITYVTLTYIVNSVAESATPVASGTKVTLPTVPQSAFVGYSFVGWTTAQLYETTVKPTIIEEYTPTDDTTLYAVFARVEAGGESAVSQFVPVTDASQLALDAEVVIVSADYAFAMSDIATTPQGSEYRNKVAITKGVGVLEYDENDAPCVLTLGSGTSSGSWSFYDTANAAFICSAETGNYMTTEETLSAAGSFVIEIANGTTTITSNGDNVSKIIKYNASFNRFSCYKLTSGDVSDVMLYIKSGSFTTYYTTEPGAALEYTVTATVNNTDFGSARATGYAIVCTPAEGYEIKDCTLVSGTAAWTIDGNTVSVVPSSDCTIRVNFGEIEIPPFKYQENTPYHFALTQKKLDGAPTLYFTGLMDGYYFATSTSEEDAADVYLEEVDGGYRLYTMPGGTKTYLDIYAYSSTGVGITLTETPSAVFRYDETIDIFVATVLGKENCFGAYNSYSTFSRLETSYFTGENAKELDVSEFPARLVALPSATISYNVNGACASTASAPLGREYTLSATARAFFGYDFIGWVAAEQMDETAALPEIVTSITATKDATYYALYQNTESTLYTTRPVVTTDEIPGDFNGDTMVTDADAIYLLYYTFYPEDFPITQSADFNHDGVVTDADAIYLLYYTFYPEDFPLTQN